ncbi:MAG TPA: hypothetical protein VEJ84_21425, partial [Acidimicrobiales bacterium]|nr:hypothetical protein [Acidimicrobiales bacterium]
CWPAPAAQVRTVGCGECLRPEHDQGQNAAERALKGTSYPEGARGYTGAIMGPVASVERVPASLLPR